MPVDQTDIANMALDLLTEGAIDSLDEDLKAARLLSRHWDTTVESELTKNAWTFAIVSAEIAGADLGTADGTLNWAYELPADALRPLPLTYDGQAQGIPINWRQEGGFVYSDQSSPRIIRYIANVTDPAEWSALFTEAIAAALAIKIAHPLTAKANMIQIAQGAYDRAIAEARRTNAIEKTGRLFRENWLLERGDTRFARP